MPTLTDMREHVRSAHAAKAKEPPAVEFADADTVAEGESDPDDELTEDEENALERQEVLAAEEDLERGKAAAGIEPRKWA
jgi:hypothetical protein